MSTAKPTTQLGDVLSHQQLRTLIAGFGNGDWIEIDAPGHSGAALVVWRMAGAERSPECEARARRMAAADELLELVIQTDDWLYRQIGSRPDERALRAAIVKATEAPP